MEKKLEHIKKLPPYLKYGDIAERKWNPIKLLTSTIHQTNEYALIEYYKPKVIIYGAC